MLCQKSKYAQSVAGLCLSATQLEDVQCAIHPLLKAYVQDVANTATISMVNDTTVWHAEMKSVESDMQNGDEEESMIGLMPGWSLSHSLRNL